MTVRASFFSCLVEVADPSPFSDNRIMRSLPPVAFSTAYRLPARTGLALVAAATMLTGCDALGIDTPAKQAQRREAEGKAIGAACRHTQRSLEDCYASNPKASKAAIFAGWREMDEYMRENDIPPAPPAPPKVADSDAVKEEIVAPAAPAAAPSNAAPAASSPPTGSIVPRIAPPATPAAPAGR